MRNRAGITQRCQTGTDEAGYSKVTKTESVRGGGLGRGGTGREMSSPENLRDNEEEIYRGEKRKVFTPAHP